MNECFIKGELVENAILRGKKIKALVFTAETKHSTNNNDGVKENSTLVPCVMFNPEAFNPDAALAESLVQQGKGTACFFKGRVQGSKYEAPGGQTRFSAEVTVFNSTFTVLKS